jgi:hypothetical protein
VHRILAGYEDFHEAKEAGVGVDLEEVFPEGTGDHRHSYASLKEVEHFADAFPDADAAAKQFGIAFGSFSAEPFEHPGGGVRGAGERQNALPPLEREGSKTFRGKADARLGQRLAACLEVNRLGVHEYAVVVP